MSWHRKYCPSLNCRNTFGVGVVNENGVVLANEKSMYIPGLGKGIVPREATDHHVQSASHVLKSALNRSNVKMENIDAIAVALGAGLPPCLHVGASIARYISLKYKKPLIPVCHQIAHIEIGKLTTKANDPVILYLSGGNTQIIAFVEGKYRIFGETEDIPIGNALDVLARQLGFKMPGGPEIEKAAENGRYVEIPYVIKGMDMSFSGILTESIKKFEEGARKEDICFSFQETCFAMLIEATERALAHTEKKEVLLVGGVASNKRLQEMLRIMCEERDAELYVVPSEYSSDNGAMIAWTGVLVHKTGEKLSIKRSKIKQKWRTDEVTINYLK